MKKVFALVLTIALLIAMTACGNSVKGVDGVTDDVTAAKPEQQEGVDPDVEAVLAALEEARTLLDGNVSVENLEWIEYREGVASYDVEHMSDEVALDLLNDYTGK